MKSLITSLIRGLVALSIAKPWLTMISIMGLIIFGLQSLEGLKVDTSNESYLQEDDPVRIHFLENRKIYGGDNIIAIGIETPNGDIFAKPFLEKLKSYHTAIENMPLVNRVDSIINAREVRGEDDELLIIKADEDWSKTLGNLEEYERIVTSNPVYINKLFSHDRHFSLINVTLNNYSTEKPGEFLTDAEMQKAVQSVFDLADDYRAEDFQFYFSGIPTVTYRITQSLQDTMGSLALASMIVMIILLSLIFRRAMGVIIPCSMIFFSLLITFEMMALTNTTAMVSIQIIPSLVIAFGICDSVHYLTVFFKTYAENGNKRRAILVATEKTAFALFMTTVTTAAGLISFAFTDMPPVAFLGIFGAVGIIAAFILTFSLMPAMLMALPVKAFKAKSNQPSMIDTLCVNMSQIGINYPKSVTLTAVAILVLFGLLFSQLRFAHETIKWYKPSDPLRSDIEKIDNYLNGHFTVDIIIRKEGGGNVVNQQIMQLLEDIRQYAVEHSYKNVTAGSTTALTDMIRETNRALNDNDQAHYNIPKDDELLAQELLLFEMGSSEDLYQLTEPGFNSTRVVLNMPATDLIQSYHFTNMIKKAFEDKVPEGYNLSITGTPTLAGQAFGSMLGTMITSYLIAFIIVSLLIVIMSTIKIGLISIVVNTVPITFTLILMALMDIPLDIFTMLVGSIMLGVVVDDSIHYIEKLKTYLSDGTNDLSEAILHASNDIGRSLFFTTSIVGIGFLTYAFSDMQNIFAFGLLVFSTAVVALLADLILLPAMLVLFSRQEKVAAIKAKA